GHGIRRATVLDTSERDRAVEREKTWPRVERGRRGDRADIGAATKVVDEGAAHERRYSVTTRPRSFNERSAASSSRTMRRPATPSFDGVAPLSTQSTKYPSSSVSASVASTFGPHTSPER